MFQAALRSIIYANSSDNPTTAPRTVTFFVLDSAPTGSFPATSQVAVAAVDDAPVNTVPGPQITPGNTPKIFSTANSNAISVADVDAGAGKLRPL
jgi:hypothetical protein